MKKSFLISLSVASLLSASDYFYLGGDLNRSELTVNHQTDDFKDTSFGVKMGYKLDNFRYYLRFDNMKFQNYDIKTSSLNIDYLYSMDTKWNWFIGTNLTRANLDSNILISKNNSTEFGLQTGFLYESSKKWNFEIGYRRTALNESFQNNIDREMVDRIDSVFIGINYKFLTDADIKQPKKEILDIADSDHDGIPNYKDRCVTIQASATVDNNGCTIKENRTVPTPKKFIYLPIEEKLDLDDTDKDGILNYQDKCPNSPLDSVVNKNGCQINITLLANFATDSSKINEKFKYDLKDIISILKQNTNIMMKLTGHTDNIGSKKYNQKLSQQRVNSIIKYLIEMGIDSKRLSGKGYGETQPLVSNNTPENRARNRRVEFTFFK